MAGSRSVVVTSPVSEVSGTTLYSVVDAEGAEVPGPRLAVIARTHGNEPVGDPVLARLADIAAQHLVRGSLLAVRANEFAAAIDRRHTEDGSDLNRMWDTATLARLEAKPAEHRSYEETRALLIAPLLLGCDGVLDLHSTSRPAAPFLVMRDDQAHATLALTLGVQRLITGLHENSILSGGVAANVGLAPAERSPRLGFTFEAGQHSDPDNAARAWEVTVRFLAGFGIWEPAPAQSPVQAEVYEILERFKQAAFGTEPYRFVGYDGGEPGAGRRNLPPRRLHSFEEIQADEVILRRGRSEVVRSHQGFTMLMPAPATPPDTDLYYVAQPRHGGLTNGVPRTDDDARREALAIERMLDLLGDDEFERGTTWVAFDNQRLQDLAANIIGRTLRLEPGHPHRALLVVGRGESLGDENERRAGHRYREAMRAAIADGLPVERIQLLRGASLAWIDLLTGRGMQELVAARRMADLRRGATPSPLRLRLSLRQPHTASLLVGGDLDRALETGDTRHVRVAVLIEAATVEPYGATARVKVSRAGLVSTRPEVLVAAGNLVRTLRDEHAALVHLGSLRDEPGIRAVLQPDDGIEGSPDPEQMAELRTSLYRAQLRLWCDQLRTELRTPERLAGDQELGQWLAATMAATGILDADALASLVVRPDGAGYTVDPALVHELYDQVHAPPGGDPAFLPAATAEFPPTPPQPLFASEVRADDLERFVSWTRFVRACHVVPETRGTDLDLAFRGADIRETLARWFDRARAQAGQAKGDVLVVVSGDGLNPTRDRMSEAFPMYRAHRAVVLDPSLHYLRIQHAQGTHLSWMRDFLSSLHTRPRGSQSVSLQFEAEHGATVNVVMVLTRDRTFPDEPRPWSLDGWEVTACGIVLSDLESLGEEDYKLGLFTERGTGRNGGLNLELAHFGRAHCEGLLRQAGAHRVRAEDGPALTDEIERTILDLLGRWIERVRQWRRSSHTIPGDLDERGRWVAHRLGLSDPWLARFLAREMDQTTPPEQAAKACWDAVPSWPGPTWIARADAVSALRSIPPDRVPSK
jgi:predicted deacylase